MTDSSMPHWTARQQEVLASLGFRIWLGRAHQLPTAPLEAPPVVDRKASGRPSTSAQARRGVSGPPPAAAPAPAPAASRVPDRPASADSPAYSLVLLAVGEWVLILDAAGPDPGRFSRDLAFVLNTPVPTAPMALQWPGSMGGALSRDPQAAANGVLGAIDGLGGGAGVIALGPQASHWAQRALAGSPSRTLVHSGRADLVQGKRELWAQLEAQLAAATSR